MLLDCPPPEPQEIASPSLSTEPSHPPRFALQLMKAGSCLLQLGRVWAFPRLEMLMDERGRKAGCVEGHAPTDARLE
jgi:hypothetical protein